MHGYQAPQKQPMSRNKKIAIGAAVAVRLPAVVAGMIAGAQKETDSTPAGAPMSQDTAAANATPAPTKAPGTAAPKPGTGPTFAYRGDPQCAITYRDRGNGTMIWTATVTLAGQLRTHAGDRGGGLYAHDTPVTRGPSAFAAPVPLSGITDIGGILTAAGRTYTCSVAPAK